MHVLHCCLQVWMCGGKVLISTCSRVGHVFRKVSPYTWPGGVVNILNHNAMRTAEVWMDKYKEFLYKVNPCKTVLLPSPRVTYRCHHRGVLLL